MPRKIETEIRIAAPPDRVWAILVDFSAYPDWNPFIIAVNGTATAGGRLQVSIAPPGRRPMRFRPTVLLAEPRRELKWRGQFLMPGLFDGEHRFQLEAVPDGTLFRQDETFSGLLVPLAGKGLFTAVAAGFKAMNSALKARAEAQPAG